MGYKVHVGQASGEYDQVLDAGTATEYTVSGLGEEGYYYFAVTAYDDVDESGYSAEVSTDPRPARPTGLRIDYEVNVNVRIR